MKLYYPAIFMPYENGFTVEFPDLHGCVTQGDSLEEAFEMAVDAACGWILTSVEDGENVPSPSAINSIEVSDGFVNYISLNIEEYAKQYSTKAVKKTLTIPQWLNCLAERRGINFSQELQYALKERLGLTVNTVYDYVTELHERVVNLERLFINNTELFTQNSDNMTLTEAESSKVIPLYSWRPECRLKN